MQEQTSEEPGQLFERPFVGKMCEVGREGVKVINLRDSKSSTSNIFHFNHDCQSEHVPFAGRSRAGDLIMK